MHLDLTKEELRVLNVVLQNMTKDKDSLHRLLAGYTDDAKTLGSIAGKVRGSWELEKTKA